MNISAWAARWNCQGQALEELMQVIAPAQHSLHMQHSGLKLSESNVQAYLRVHAPKLGFSLWRNNNGACIDETGRQIRYGLGNDSAKINHGWKSSDLIGIGPDGRFVAVEVKPSDWRGPRNDREKAQENFINTVKSLGGYAGFATRIDDYERIIRL